MKNVGEFLGLVSAVLGLIGSTAGLIAILSRRQDVVDGHESAPEDVLLLQRLRMMQIIAIALLMGSLAFLAIAFFLLLQNDGHGLAPAQDVPVLLLVAAVMLAAVAPLAFLLPGIQSRSALQRIVAGNRQASRRVNPTSTGAVTAQLLPVYQTSLIVSLALLEGASHMGCLAYLVEGQPLALGVSGVAILLMLLKFPTESRVQAWLEQQAAQLAHLREQQDFATEG